MTTNQSASLAARRYAVVGQPVAHSRSPWIHARFGEQTGIALHYGLLEPGQAEFAQAVTRFFHQGGSGLNVTVPFKAQAYALAQQASPRARLAQAANTLWMQGGKMHACNTDGVGLVRDLVRQGGVLHDRRILLVGAGGAARGVLYPLLEGGCAQLRIVNRTANTAQQLAEHLIAQARQWLPDCADRVSHGGLPDAAAVRWDVVINASSSSLHGQAPELPNGIYADDAMAYDMMYGASPTPFLQRARAQGAAHLVDGLGMLVQQAAESFFLWHGVRPDPEPVLTALRAALQHAPQTSSQGAAPPSTPQSP